MDQGEFLRRIGDSLVEFLIRWHLVCQLADGTGNEAALHFDHGRPLAAEAGGDIRNSSVRLDHFAAGEDVHSRVPVFRPGVNGEVRFRDDHDPADAKGVEFMKRDVDDRGPARASGSNQNVFHDVYFLQRVWVTTVEFDQQVSAQSVQ